MNPRTRKAIETALRASNNDDFCIAEDDGVTVTVYITTVDYIDPHYGHEPASRSVDFEIEAHQLENGRWIRAYRSERHLQWQSADFSARFVKYNPQAVYVFARSLEALAGDIRTYPSASAAIKAALADRNG